MKLAINASMIGNQPTGTDHYARSVIYELVRLPAMQEHQIEVFTPELLDLPNSCKQHKLPSNLGRSNLQKGNGWRRFLWNQTTFSQLANSFDHIYCPTYNTSLAISGQTITIHDLLALRYPNQHFAQYVFAKTVLPSLLARAKNIISVSETTKQELVENYSLNADKISVIPNGFDQQLFTPKTLETSEIDRNTLQKFQLKAESYALIVGATYPHKNIEVVLNAFAEIALAHRNLQLAIVGGDSFYLREIKKRLKSIGFNNQVLFLGYVSNPELASLYRQASMLLYPSRFEGFGLPLIEAMASGCPVIASETPSLMEVGRNACIYCKSEDTDDWRVSIQELHASPFLRSQYIALGLKHVQQYSWKNTATQIALTLLA